MLSCAFHPVSAFRLRKFTGVVLAGWFHLPQNIDEFSRSAFHLVYNLVYLGVQVTVADERHDTDN